MDGNNLAERLAKLSPAKRALLERKLSELGRESSTLLTIPRRAERDLAPLSFAQQRLWFINQLDPASPAYHECTAFRLTGALDVDALYNAINRLIERHEVLRTKFVTIDDNPMQKISDHQSVETTCIDLRSRPVEDREFEAHRLMTETAQRPFDLGVDVLLRPLLIRVNDREQLLLIVRHHIASDGWSASIFRRELSVLYNAFANREDPSLPELPVQYADYAVWQRQYLSGEVLEAQLAYWRKQLAGVSALNLPTDRPRPVVQSSQCDRESVLLPRNLLDQLRSLSNAQGATLFMTLLACFKILLHRYTGQNDIAVGSPIAGRTRAEIEGLIGFFVNTLVLRTDLSGNPTFKELLRRSRDTVLEAFEHQELPFEKLVEDLNPERTRSRAPLLQVMFALQNVPWHQLDMTGLTATPMEIGSSTGKFDLYTALLERDRELTLRVEYSTDLFDAATIRRMMGHFQTLLESVVADPGGRIDALPIITDDEFRQVTVAWNNTARDYPRDKSILELFEQQVKHNPQGIALISQSQGMSYLELDQKSNQLARYLKSLGVGPQSLVAICVQRSISMVVGLLGILKSDAAYVPLDPSYPKERLAFMLSDTAAPLVLTEKALERNLPQNSARRVCLDTDWCQIEKERQDKLENDIAPEALAYIIYTSGSTGTAKGVAVSHQAINRLVMNSDYLRLRASDVVAQASNVSFDAATFEIWGALLNGARLALVTQEELLSPRSLSSAIDRYGITTLFLTTALFNQMVEQVPAALGKLQHLLFGGEAVDAGRVRDLLAKAPPHRLLHVYGPTESTTFTSWYDVKEVSEGGQTVPIGRPIANTSMYLLDCYLQPVPIGVTGELYIGGDGLATRYHNRPELTAEKFIADPFSTKPGVRLYRTGDLARYLPDGSVEFIGRADNQVKIRGFRIELGEIEWILSQHKGVQQAIVLAQEDIPGEKRLVAYLLGQPNGPKADELRNYLRTKLPDYMIPSAVIFVDAFPITSNGKIDRNALQLLGRGQVSTAAGSVAPRTPAEAQLAQIWAEILNVERVGAYDNFFDLGGHSLLAIRLLARMREEFGVEFPLGRFFEGPTIAHIAEELEVARCREGEGTHGNKWAHLFKLKGGDGAHPVYVFPGGFGGENEALVLAQLAHFVGREYPFYGLRARSSQGTERGHRSVEEMARDFIQEIRELQPCGPYYLLGHCLGGVVAYEVACQLQEQGERVDMLGFLDTVRPTRGRYLRFRAWRILEKMVPDWKFYYRERLAYHLAKLKMLAWRERANYLTSRLSTVREALDLEPTEAPKDGSYQPKLRQLRDNQSGHITTLLRYRARRYHGRIHSLVADGMLRRRKDATLGWQKYAVGGVVAHRGTGDHDSFLRDYTKNVGALVRSWIEGSKIEMVKQVDPQQSVYDSSRTTT